MGDRYVSSKQKGRAMNKILIVEDDGHIAKNLSLLLSQEGYAVTRADGQKAAVELLESNRFDLILLDISLPDGNGYTVCTAAKRLGGMPVIFLTASDDEISVVTGLDMGADDYITKPFRPMELLSRVKSVLRRTGKVESVFEVGDINIDSVRGVVTKNGAEVFIFLLCSQGMVDFPFIYSRFSIRIHLVEVARNTTRHKI